MSKEHKKNSKPNIQSWRKEREKNAKM